MITLKDRLWALALVLLALLGFLLAAGCGGLLHPAPHTAHQTLPAPPGQVYRDAACAFARLGGQMTASDGTHGLLSGQVHDAVTLTVLLTPEGTGTAVQVTGQVLPNKIVVGRFTEVDDYMALLTAQPCGQQARR